MSTSKLRKSKVAGSIARRTVAQSIERRHIALEKEVASLIEASLSVIRKTGKLEPRVSEVVAEAGLSNQVFYKHFRSKDELLLAVLDEGSSNLKSYLEHRMEKATIPAEKISEWIAGMFSRAQRKDVALATRPFALSRARLSDLFPEDVRRSEMQIIGLLRDAINEAVLAGDMPNAEPESDSDLIYNMASGWLERRLADPSLSNKTDISCVTEFILSGLRRGVTPGAR